jgi:hypothetical protein
MQEETYAARTEATKSRPVVVRAVPGVVQQLQPGMLLQVSGDLAGVVDAVVVADHRDHRGAGERSEQLVQQRDEVGGAAAAQPVHPRAGGHLDWPRSFLWFAGLPVCCSRSLKSCTRRGPRLGWCPGMCGR